MRRLSLKAIGFLSALVYAANAIHYGWGPFSKTALDDLLAWLTVLALLALYWAGYKRLQTRTYSFAEILLPALPLVALSFLTIPYDSTDIFLYMDVGWAQTRYDINPYVEVLRDVPNITSDPMIRSDWMQSDKNPWLDLPFVYGFLFAAIVKVIAWCGHGHWWLTLFFFKSVNLSAWFVCCRLLWSLTSAVGGSRADVPLYLFSWSPLILQHHIANGHNDLLVGCLLMIAARLIASSRHDFWAPAVLIASAMIKYLTLPLVLLSLWYIGRRSGWIRAAASAIPGALVLAVSLPYIRNWSQFRFEGISAQLFKTTAGSFYAFLFYFYRFAAHIVAPFGTPEVFGFGLQILLWLFGAAGMSVVVFRFCRQRKPSFDDWVVTSSWIIVAIVLVISSQFYSWYLGMFFPFALLMRADHKLRTFLVLLSGTQAFSLTSLSRKGIGYFSLTLIPTVAMVYNRRRSSAARSKVSL